MARNFTPTRPRTHTITLLWPFSLDGVSYTELSLRRPNTDDLTIVAAAKDQADGVKKSRQMLAGLAQIDPDVVGYLDPDDMAQINAWLEPILDPKGPPSPTGGD